MNNSIPSFDAHGSKMIFSVGELAHYTVKQPRAAKIL